MNKKLIEQRSPFGKVSLVATSLRYAVVVLAFGLLKYFADKSAVILLITLAMMVGIDSFVLLRLWKKSRLSSAVSEITQNLYLWEIEILLNENADSFVDSVLDLSNRIGIDVEKFAKHGQSKRQIALSIIRALRSKIEGTLELSIMKFPIGVEAGESKPTGGPNDHQ